MRSRQLRRGASPAPTRSSRSGSTRRPTAARRGADWWSWRRRPPDAGAPDRCSGRCASSRTGRLSSCEPRRWPPGPRSPRRCGTGCDVRTAANAATQRAAARGRGDPRPAPGGSDRLRLEAQARRVRARRSSRARRTSPSWQRPRCSALAESDVVERPAGAMPATFDEVAGELEQHYVAARATEASAHSAATRIRSPTGTGSSSTCTCTRATRTTARPRSPTCSTTPRPKGSARSPSPTTTCSAAPVRPSSSPAPRLIVIPGEEVKTDGQGEVIGLFLREEIPRGMSFADTIAAIREQDGLVYVPHPFDRLHAIPSPETLHRHLPDIDVFEVYNARLLFESFNDEALRFARKYGLLAGAGSDAHVLQGVGTGAVRMRRVRRPRGVPALAAHRRGAPAAEVARVPAVPQVGRPGQGEGPLEDEVFRAVCPLRPCPTTSSMSATSSGPSARSTTSSAS